MKKEKKRKGYRLIHLTLLSNEQAQNERINRKKISIHCVTGRPKFVRDLNQEVENAHGIEPKAFGLFTLCFCTTLGSMVCVLCMCAMRMLTNYTLYTHTHRDHEYIGAGNKQQHKRD